MTASEAKNIANEEIRKIRKTIEQQRKKNSVRTRPLISEQDLMVRRVLDDGVRLAKVTEELSTALTTILGQLDPFVDGYDEAQEALGAARFVVDCSKANWARLPEKVRRGVDQNHQSLERSGRPHTRTVAFISYLPPFRIASSRCVPIA